MRVAASWTRASVRPVRTTWAPAAASAWLMAKPRPLVPPVTSARTPSRSGDGSVMSSTLPWSHGVPAGWFSRGQLRSDAAIRRARRGRTRPYPMLAGIRADTPVLHVQLSTGPGGRYQHDEQAPRIAPGPARSVRSCVGRGPMRPRREDGVIVVTGNRADALARLDVFVGEWVVEARFPGQPAPSGAAGDGPVVRSRFEWALDRQFLLQRTEVPIPGAPDGLMIVSADLETGAYTQHYYDSRGGRRRSRRCRCSASPPPTRTRWTRCSGRSCASRTSPEPSTARR
jgi:hypothetical protein